MNHVDDEVLSALLDGEAPSGDAAHVDGCETCSERLAGLRRVSTAVAAPVVLPAAHVREAAVSIALDSASTRPAVRTYIQRWNGLSAAAALLVALAVGGLLIAQLGRGGNDETRNAQDRVAADTGVAAGGGFSNESSLGASSDAATGPYQAGDLGSVTDVEALYTRATMDLGQPPKAAMTMAVSACPVEIAGQVLWQATLNYNGTPAVAHLVETPEGRVMQVLRQSDCAVLVSQGF